MQFLLTITAIMTLCFLRPSYREFKSGKYRFSQTVWVVIFLIVFVAVAWVGSLAWENKLPEFWTKGALGAVVGSAGVATFTALFVVPTVVGRLLSQALTGAFWAMRCQRAAGPG